jgi:hypothetical protein
MRATSFQAGLTIWGKRVTIDIDEVQMAITVPGIRVGVLKSAMETYPESVEHITSVDYLRSGDIDMSKARVGFYVDAPSKNEAVGCAPPLTKRGDIVVVFATARTPFILRPRDLLSFELVCDCYLQGFMHGEAPEEVKEFEDFVIV